MNGTFDGEVWHTVSYLIGGAVGLVFGSLVAWLNSRLTAHYLQKPESERKNHTVGVLAMSFGRMLVSFGALLLVFLVRNLLPWPFAAVILGTALGLTLVSFVIIFRLSKKYQDT